MFYTVFYPHILHSGIPDAGSAHRPLWMTRYEADHLSGSCGTRHKADVRDYDKIKKPWLSFEALLWRFLTLFAWWLMTFQ